MESLGGPRFESNPEQPAEKREDIPIIQVDKINTPGSLPTVLQDALKAYQARSREFLKDIRRIHCPPNLLAEYDRIHNISSSPNPEGNSTPINK